MFPFGAKFTRGRSRKGAYEMFDFGAPRAPRTVPTGLVAEVEESEMVSQDFRTSVAFVRPAGVKTSPSNGDVRYGDCLRKWLGGCRL